MTNQEICKKAEEIIDKGHEIVSGKFKDEFGVYPNGCGMIKHTAIGISYFLESDTTGKHFGSVFYATWEELNDKN